MKGRREEGKCWEKRETRSEKQIILRRDILRNQLADTVHGRY